MKFKQKLLGLCILALSVSGINQAFAQDKIKIEDLSWLAGCWKVKPERPNLDQYENWSISRAGDLMLGVSWSIADKQTRQFEFMRVHALENGDLAYAVQPSSLQKTETFKLTSQDPRKLVFENGERKFPNKITYEWRAEGAFVARLEGDLDGKPQKAEFPFKRSSCDGERVAADSTKLEK